MRTIARETALQFLEKLLQRGGGKVSVTYDFGEVGTCSQAHMLAEAVCQSCGADVTVNDFSAFLDMRRGKNWAHKIFS